MPSKAKITTKGVMDKRNINIPNYKNIMKRKIAIVAGGDSSEWQVSMRSAAGLDSFIPRKNQYFKFYFWF